MNDADREEIARNGGADGDYPGADRMNHYQWSNAEIAKLREEARLHKYDDDELDRLRAELTRLREALEYERKKSERAVTVRAENAKLRARNEGLWKSVSRQADELARLREDGIAGRDTAYRRRDAAEAENVRLREMLEYKDRRYGELLKEQGGPSAQGR